MKLVELAGIETGVVPKDITGAAQTGDWISFENYTHATVIIQQGSWAGGTPAVTLEQAKTAAGGDNVPLSFTKRWTKVGVTGTTFVETAVASDTFNLPAIANTINVLEIDAADLNTGSGYTFLSCLVASPGGNADLLCIMYVLSGPRYAQAVMPDAKL